MSKREKQDGSALIEFAGSLMLLAALLTGIFRVGYTFYVYDTRCEPGSAMLRCGRRIPTWRDRYATWWCTANRDPRQARNR